jgi:hypothetical protein
MQPWSARRVGLAAAIVLLLALAAQNPTLIFDNRMAVKDLAQHPQPRRGGPLEPLWLEAQSVPSASFLPCVRTPLPGWRVADVAVNDGRTVITLDHDRAGEQAVVARLTAACDITGTVQTPSPVPGVRHAERVERLAGGFSASWYDRFPGGCLSYRLRSTGGCSRPQRSPDPSGFPDRSLGMGTWRYA